MTKRLYLVITSGYVVAENETYAKNLVMTNVLQVDGMDIHVEQAQCVDDAWRDCLPYSEDDDDQRTCAQVFAETPKEATGTLKRVLDDLMAGEPPNAPA